MLTIGRVGKIVARFDTVVFNPITNILEVWRYREGLYSGKHDLVFSIGTNWIKSDLELRGAVCLIREIAGLYIYSEESNLPSPWRGYRFT